MFEVRVASAETLADDLLEGKAEVFAEQRVYKRVKGAVAIAEPKHDTKDWLWDHVRVEPTQQVQGEEWQPAAYEATNNDGQGLGSFCFHAESFHLGFDVSFAHLIDQFWFVPATLVFIGRTSIFHNVTRGQVLT